MSVQNQNTKTTTKKQYDVYVCVPEKNTVIINKLLFPELVSSLGKDYFTATEFNSMQVNKGQNQKTALLNQAIVSMQAKMIDGANNFCVVAGTRGELYTLSAQDLASQYQVYTNGNNLVNITEEVLAKRRKKGTNTINWMRARCMDTNSKYIVGLIPVATQMQVQTSTDGIVTVNTGTQKSHGKGDFQVCDAYNRISVYNGLAFADVFNIRGLSDWVVDNEPTPFKASDLPALVKENGNIGEKAFSVYRSTAKKCLMAWCNMSAEEAEKESKTAPISALEKEIGASGSLISALEGLVKAEILDANVLNYSGSLLADTNELEYFILQNKNSDGRKKATPNKCIAVLSYIHQKWVTDNAPRFAQKVEKGVGYQYLPLEYIGFEEVYKDYVFLEGYLKLLDTRFSKEELEKAYNTYVSNKLNANLFKGDNEDYTNKTGKMIEEIYLYQDGTVDRNKLFDIAKYSPQVKKILGIRKTAKHDEIIEAPFTEIADNAVAQYMKVLVEYTNMNGLVDISKYEGKSLEDIIVDAIAGIYSGGTGRLYMTGDNDDALTVQFKENRDKENYKSVILVHAKSDKSTIDKKFVLVESNKVTPDDIFDKCGKAAVRTFILICRELGVHPFRFLLSDTTSYCTASFLAIANDRPIVVSRYEKSHDGLQCKYEVRDEKDETKKRIVNLKLYEISNWREAFFDNFTIGIRIGKDFEVKLDGNALKEYLQNENKEMREDLLYENVIQYIVGQLKPIFAAN